MKRLIDYINESTQIDVDKLLPKISHISFSGIPNRKVIPGSKDAFDLAKDQESFVIDTLSTNLQSNDSTTIDIPQ